MILEQLNILDHLKRALRLTVENYDYELLGLIEAAKIDLGIAGVVVPEKLDPIIRQAIITYCRYHFERLDPAESERLKASYDEQKAQLMTATGYTVWGSSDAG